MKFSSRVISVIVFLLFAQYSIALPTTENVTSSVSIIPRAQVQRSQVSIRIIEASEEKSLDSTDPESLVLDPRLEDLREKFIHLPYSDFKLNAEATKFISIKQKEPIRFMNGQRVYVRVVDYTNEESTIWLRWINASGEVLLDTRMGVIFNDAMVIGLDQMTPLRDSTQQSKSGQGLVLAVKVSPIVTGG